MDSPRGDARSPELSFQVQGLKVKACLCLRDVCALTMSSPASNVGLSAFSILDSYQLVGLLKCSVSFEPTRLDLQMLDPQ